MGYSVAGTYLESCNCDSICPCRQIGGRPGGRSTHGICVGVLSWHVEHGHAEGVELSGLAVALVCRYDDDEDGSPWTVALHVDERAKPEAEAALADIFLGRLGGGRVELDHVSERRWLKVAERVVLRVGPPVTTDETVSCIVPGHDQEGVEYHAELLQIHDDELDAELVGVCAFSAPFAYASED